MEITLASNSPRRLKYLAEWGFKFKPVKPAIEEVSFVGDPLRTVMTNAYLKAFSAIGCESSVVLGIDTVVFFAHEILGKPLSESKNVKMIEALSGHTHFVFSGIAVLYGGHFLIDSVKTAVSFRQISKGEIEQYVATGEGLDKAGGYAIQGLASSFVESVEGPLDNVIGVPVLAIRQLIDKILKLEI
ncbi:MAG: Maf family protein [Caldisericaceae bacterium]